MKPSVIVTVKEKNGLDYDVELPVNVPVSQLAKDIAEVINDYNEKKVLPQDSYALYCDRMGKTLPGNRTLMELGVWNGDILVLQ